jgi:deoxyribonuclease-4
VASTNNRIRIPSRKILSDHAAAAASIGAHALIVHGGHVTQKDDPAVGVDNWRKTFERAQAEGGFPIQILIENTAGGDNAMARRFDRLAMLWDAVGEYDVGFVLDTCHAWAGGEELADIAQRVRAMTGPHRPRAREQLPGHVRLRPRPACQLRLRHVRLGVDRRGLP